MAPQKESRMKLGELRARIAQLEARAAITTGPARNQALTDTAHTRARLTYWERTTR